MSVVITGMVVAGMTRVGGMSIVTIVAKDLTLSHILKVDVVDLITAMVQTAVTTTVNKVVTITMDRARTVGKVAMRTTDRVRTMDKVARVVMDKAITVDRVARVVVTDRAVRKE
jgi:hypothetical protein